MSWGSDLEEPRLRRMVGGVRDGPRREERVEFGEGCRSFLTSLGAAEEDLGKGLDGVGQFGVVAAKRVVSEFRERLAVPVRTHRFGHEGATEEFETLFWREARSFEQAAEQGSHLFG